MHQQTLADFVEEKGQTAAAELLGLTQPGIGKALRKGRQIYVTKHPDGRYEAAEVRPFPSITKDHEGAA